MSGTNVTLRPLRTPQHQCIYLCWQINRGLMMDDGDLVVRAVAAFNAHDAGAFAALFADDGVIFEYPDRAVARGREAVRTYAGGMFASFPASKVELLGRTDLGTRQITHERIHRGDGSPPYEAGLVYDCSEGHIERMDFVRAL